MAKNGSVAHQPIDRSKIDSNGVYWPDGFPDHNLGLTGDDALLAEFRAGEQGQPRPPAKFKSNKPQRKSRASVPGIRPAADQPSTRAQVAAWRRRHGQ